MSWGVDPSPVGVYNLAKMNSAAVMVVGVPFPMDNFHFSVCIRIMFASEEEYLNCFFWRVQECVSETCLDAVSEDRAMLEVFLQLFLGKHLWCWVWKFKHLPSPSTQQFISGSRGRDCWGVRAAHCAPMGVKWQKAVIWKARGEMEYSSLAQG